MNENLSGQQFAQYSSILNDDDSVWEDEKRNVRRPAHLERHAPGEYQPTLPGMEQMLPNEQTHVSVFFKHPNQMDKEEAEVPGSDWYNKTHVYLPEHVKVRTRDLRPTQDWIDENHIHEPPHRNTLAASGTTPKVEHVGTKNIVHDGHHRAVRAILAGQKSVEVERY